jgi:isoprenylcysteine carboxyl methyltransferase (ICMT) family protein YpbQ
MKRDEKNSGDRARCFFFFCHPKSLLMLMIMADAFIIKSISFRKEGFPFASPFLSSFCRRIFHVNVLMRQWTTKIRTLPCVIYILLDLADFLRGGGRKRKKCFPIRLKFFF